MSAEPEDVYFWLRFAVTAFAAIVIFHRRIAVTISGVLFAFKTIPPPTLDGEFVERPQLEKEILNAVSSGNSETVLIYGERGGGKTTLIQHAFKKKRGVMTVGISATSYQEAQEEMIQKISTELHVLSVPQPDKFIEDVFAVVPTSSPIVIVSLEAKCGGETLEAVVTKAKLLSYEQRYKRHPRIVIDISGSRPAIDSGIQFVKRRVVGVHVGQFKDKEALLYVKQRIPNSFSDPLRRGAIASLIVEKFDWHVIILQEICGLLKALQSTNPKEVEALIRKQTRLAEESAWSGWRSFATNLESAASSRISEECWGKVARLLLKGEQQVRVIIEALDEELLAKDTLSRLTPQHIGLANADAPYHPLAYDPFKTTVSLAGKAVAAKLAETYVAAA